MASIFPKNIAMATIMFIATAMMVHVHTIISCMWLCGGSDDNITY